MPEPVRSSTTARASESCESSVSAARLPVNLAPSTGKSSSVVNSAPAVTPSGCGYSIMMENTGESMPLFGEMYPDRKWSESASGSPAEESTVFQFRNVRVK